MSLQAVHEPLHKLLACELTLRKFKIFKISFRNQHAYVMILLVHGHAAYSPHQAVHKGTALQFAITSSICDLS